MQDKAFGVTVPADARYLKVVRAFFKPVMDEHFGDDAGRLILALDESCANVVKHRSGALEDGMFHVRLELSAEMVRFIIGDFCAEGDVHRIKPRDLDDIRPGGLGTHFVSEIMDRVAYEPEPEKPGRVALVMEKNLPGKEALNGDAN